MRTSVAVSRRSSTISGWCRASASRTRDGFHDTNISLGYAPYEKRVLDRAIDVDFGIEEPLRCCSAEDLVVLKTVAFREIDRSDLRRIIQASGRDIDWDLVYEELEPLLALADEPGRSNELRELVDQEL